MGWKSAVIKPYARYVAGKVKREAARPLEMQQQVFRHLIRQGAGTAFGLEHGFDGIHNHSDFVRHVPVRDYEQLRPFVDRVVAGEQDVLWPGRPQYFAKTSGTTSGTKYIPLTRESIPTHINSARNAMMCYVAETGDASVFDGKIMFISGSPVLEQKNGINIGRLSGIVNHHVPFYVKRNQIPSYQTNCIEDFEQKLDAIIDETMHADMRMISGIPPWTLMYFEKIRERTGKPVCEVFPNFSLYIYGGVNYEPYRAQTEAAIGRAIPSVETYPASEGFIAFQDTQSEPGLLLNVNAGIFFEFVPAQEIFDPNPTRLTLEQVETDVNYALLLSTNSGLWAYNIGDTVRFVSTSPYRIEVTGRIKHFISAFGEHVIGEEVEQAMMETAAKQGAVVTEFHVAPQVVPPEGGLPYHEWFVEFDTPPSSVDAFAADLDSAMCRLNSYYDDLISGKVLRTLMLRPMPNDAFRDYMRAQGKLGGQNKVPRLANDRGVAEGLEALS